MPSLPSIKHWFSLAFLAMVGTGLAACDQQKAPPDALPAPTIEVEGFEAGKISLTGRVVLKGSVPTPDTAVNTSGQQFCGSHGEVRSERWKVSENGGLAEAFIVVLEAPRTPLPTTLSSVNQSNCAYVPHVVSLSAGERLSVLNSDATIHNVRVVKHRIGTRRENEDQLFNHMTPRQGDIIQQEFAAPGQYRLECDIHRWMQAWVYVAPNNHHAISRADGSFMINRALKDGTYTAEAWHPQFPSPLRQKFSVTNGQASITLEFDASQAFKTPD